LEEPRNALSLEAASCVLLESREQLLLVGFDGVEDVVEAVFHLHVLRFDGVDRVLDVFKFGDVRLVESGQLLFDLQDARVEHLVEDLLCG